MKLQLRDLPGHLKRPLSRLYWVSGEDVFLVNQAIKDILAAAASQGFEIEKETISTAFSPDRFFTLTRALSLFANQRCILITLEAKITSNFLEALGEYFRAQDPSLILLISTGKLTPAVMQQSEFKALEAASSGFHHLAIWPIDREQMPGFLIQHAKRYHLYLDLDVARRLAMLTEGNLFAADQILEKLSLCPNSGRVSQEDLDQITENQARFELFDLVSAVLTRDKARAWRIWIQLQAQKIEPILVLWALVKEIRLLANWHEKIAENSQGNTLADLLKQHKFWEKRAKEVSTALNRVGYVRCLSLLQEGAKIDRVLKGAESGDVILLLGQFLQRFSD
jgi:DNA polymerase-3 subunit delta